MAVHKRKIFNEYLLFMSYPSQLRMERFGYKTDLMFAQKHDIGNDTLSDWKKKKNFWGRVHDLMMTWAKEAKPRVVAGVINGAIKGNPVSAKLYFQYIEGWEEKIVNKIKMEDLEEAKNYFGRGFKKKPAEAPLPKPAVASKPPAEAPSQVGKG